MPSIHALTKTSLFTIELSSPFYIGEVQDRCTKIKTYNDTSKKLQILSLFLSKSVY